VRPVEDRLRKVETHVRKLDEDHWNKSDPEKVARSEGFAAQLEAKIAKLEAELAEAKSKGDARKVKDAEDAIAAQKTWLDALG
jgi:BMFP domain-containing protein YqiC